MAGGRAVGLNLFAAIFNSNYAPVEPERTRERPVDRASNQETTSKVEFFGGSRQVAFLRSARAGPTIEGEDCDIQGLGGRFWIVGRVRLDGRADLENRLASRTDDPLRSVSDAMLCLHAYAAWRERFTDFISGDFAFALWDGEKNRLLAVRDQLGKRPLFHARAENGWLVSDSLDWIAGRISSAGEFDDYWIADFLSCGFPREFERTVYRDIRRLAPAHVLSLSDAGMSLRRYWRLDLAEPLYLPHPEAYGERFRELLTRAIADRCPSGRLGIAMSGGLDSTAMAACAVEGGQGRSRLVAACEHYRELMDIKEDYYAGLAAKRLGIELRVREIDALVYDPQWRSRTIWHHEPTVGFTNAQGYRAFNYELAELAVVWLHGEGPDNALAFDRDAYLSWLWRQGFVGKLGRALLQYVRIKGFGEWRATAWRHVGHRPEERPLGALPPWFNRDFVERCRLIERVHDLGEGGDGSHPWHPQAMASFTSPIWSSHFDEFDFYESLAPLSWRHPYLDLRVLRFMLSVPPVPWAWKKRLVREAMRGRLPREVIEREKTPLPLHPHVALIRRHGFPELSRTEDLERYVDIDALPAAQASEAEIERAIASHALVHWFALRSQKYCSFNVN